MFKPKYFLQLSSSYALMLVGIIVSIFLIPYLTGKLGSIYYGLWVLLSSIISYFSLSSFGFGTTLLKEISHNTDEHYINKYVSTTAVFFLSITFLLFIIFIFLLLNFEQFFILTSDTVFPAKMALSIIFFSYVIVFVFSVFNTILFAKGMLYIQNTIAILNMVLSATLYYFVLEAGYSIVEMALAHMLVTILSSSISVFFARKYVKFSIAFRYFDVTVLKKMLMPSTHYFLISVGAVIVLNSDNIIISSFIGLSAVATYSIGYKLIDVSQRFLFKIVDVMIPDIAQLYKKEQYKQILHLHNKTMFLSVTLATFGYAILYFYGIELLKLWVGQEFTIDFDILRLFIAFGFIHAWVHVSAIFIVAMGLHKETSYMGILDALLNILLSIVFLQYYGLMGVALGTLLSHVLTSGWFATWWFYKNIGQKLKEIENNE